MIVKNTDGGWDLWWEPAVFYRHVRGAAVLVYVDCVTLEYAPDDQQDPIFNQHGVRLPWNWHWLEALKTMWKTILSKGPLAAQ
jgi:hypothetical protein